MLYLPTKTHIPRYLIDITIVIDKMIHIVTELLEFIFVFIYNVLPNECAFVFIF